MRNVIINYFILGMEFLSEFIRVMIVSIVVILSVIFVGIVFLEI